MVISLLVYYNFENWIIFTIIILYVTYRYNNIIFVNRNKIKDESYDVKLTYNKYYNRKYKDFNSFYVSIGLLAGVFIFFIFRNIELKELLTYILMLSICINIMTHYLYYKCLR